MGVDDAPVCLQQGAGLVHLLQSLPHPVAEARLTIRRMAPGRIVLQGHLVRNGFIAL